MSKWKYYPPELKKRVVDEVASMGQITPVARRYGINRNTIHRWMVEEQAGTLMDESSLISPSGTKSLVDEVNKLKKLLGEKELENEILKDLVKKTAQQSGTKPK